MLRDAYATGMALYALYEGGVRATDSTYQSGLRYLLDTQAADGTWHFAEFSYRRVLAPRYALTRRGSPR